MVFFRSTALRFSGLILLFLTVYSSSASTFSAKRQFYQLQIFHVKDQVQEKEMDQFLADAYLPAAHRAGLSQVGVFKTFGIDTATVKKIYVLTAFNSLDELLKTNKRLESDRELIEKGSSFVNAAYDKPAFIRKEVILMEAFSGMPLWKKPELKGPKANRIYELRNYESNSDKLYRNKVQMFDKEEMEIFERIDSHPMFYGEVIAGSRMPNLMYMTVYADRASRDEHWKTFSGDPKWKQVSALPEYKNNVAVVDVTFLSPAAYSDL